MRQVEVAIIGAGASGLMAALTAAEEQKKQHRPVSVLLLESAQKPGRKLLATGNGRCNLVNARMEPSRFHGDVREAQTVLENYPPAAVVRRFQSLGLLCREEDEGRVYPNNGQASAVLNTLLYHLSALGVEILCQWPVTSLIKEGKWFRIVSSAVEKELLAEKVVLASSGKAAPQLGSDGSGYPLAQKLGHSLTPCFPALVPVCCDKKRVRGLQGMRARGKVSLWQGKTRIGEESGEIQFTEYGLSGICVFQLSRHMAKWQEEGASSPPMVLVLDLMPDMPEQELTALLRYRQRILPSSGAADALSGIINQKVGQQIIRESIENAGRLLKELSPKELEAVAQRVKHFSFPITGVQDWSRAQVTAGGIPLKEIIPETLESKKCPGLYLCGEILNLDGDCGGYNLHWAWASGMTAGKAAAKSLLTQTAKPRKSPSHSKTRRKPHAANR